MATEEPLHAQRPIMALLDVLGRRWTLRLIWELRDGPRTSRDLREAMSISPTVLQARVDELRDAGLATVDRGAGYALTDEGRALIVAFLPLHHFADGWFRKR